MNDSGYYGRDYDSSSGYLRFSTQLLSLLVILERRGSNGVDPRLFASVRPMNGNIETIRRLVASLEYRGRLARDATVFPLFFSQDNVRWLKSKFQIALSYWNRFKNRTFPDTSYDNLR